MLFILFFSFFIPIAFISLWTSRRQDKILSILLITSYLVFFGFNYKFGVDWYNYYQMYEFENSSTFSIEIGYLFLQNVFFKLGVSFWVFSLLIKIFFWFCCYSLIKKYSYYFTSVILCFIILEMAFLNENLRQLIAAALLFLAIVNIDNRSLFFFLCLILLASLFHISVILTIPIFVLYKYRKFQNITLLLIIIFFCLNLLKVDLPSYLVQLFLPMLPEGFKYKLQFYISIAQPIITMGYITRMSILLLTFIIIHKKIRENKSLELMWCGLISAISYEVFLHETPILWIRLQEYFIIFLPMVILNLIQLLRIPRTIIFLFITSYALYSFGNSFIKTDFLKSSLWENYQNPMNYIYYLLSLDDNFSEQRDEEIERYWVEWGEKNQ